MNWKGTVMSKEAKEEVNMENKNTVQRDLDSIKSDYIREIWRGCCHHCHRGQSVAGAIGDDGLCAFCRSKGNEPWW